MESRLPWAVPLDYLDEHDALAIAKAEPRRLDDDFMIFRALAHLHTPHRSDIDSGSGGVLPRGPLPL